MPHFSCPRLSGITCKITIKASRLVKWSGSRQSSCTTVVGFLPPLWKLEVNSPKPTRHTNSKAACYPEAGFCSSTKVIAPSGDHGEDNRFRSWWDFQMKDNFMLGTYFYMHFCGLCQCLSCYRPIGITISKVVTAHEIWLVYLITLLSIHII